MEDTNQCTKMQENVRKIFDQYPETKNSKKDLIRRYWQAYDKLGGVIDYWTWLRLTPGGSITRAGRFRQNSTDEKTKLKYAPTEKVKKVRKKKQTVIHGIYAHKKIDSGHPAMLWK